MKVEITTRQRAIELLDRGVELKVQVGSTVRLLEGIEDFDALQGYAEATVFRKMIKNGDGHRFTKSWAFESEEERDLANAFAAYGEMNNMSNNDVQQLFPALCRMGKGSGAWPDA